MSKSDATKPARLEVLVDNIPECLRKLRRWVVWRWCRRKKKWDKPPRQVNGKLASVDDPSTWCTFDEATAALATGKFDGIGFVLGYVEEEGVTYTGVDLDDCRDPVTGQIQEWAVSHLERLSSYAEVSPSGEGAKALAIGTLPGPDKNDSDRSGVEMYSGGRYFTITGHKLEQAPAEIHERSADLADLYHLVFGDGEPVRRKVSRQKRPDDRKLALSALDGLSTSLATNYWDWLRVGMALHGVSDDGEMLDAWDRWSRHDAEKYEEGACKRKWESFGKKGGLGLGSLIYWARQNGWELPRFRPKVEPATPGDAVILERIDAALAEGAESFFRDRELLESLGRLAETDP
ncbi:MAG TPA: PriCT-2 domain-containing protein, partial [Gemmataceae bacterium]